MRIDELMDMHLLDEMIQEGFVRTQVHPKKPLTIFNYSERAQWERVWNEVTRQCRGLIVDSSGRVLARPFPKFFNHGEPEAAEFEEGPIRVYDKLDGSLGILYEYDGEWAIATRGSFASDQAVWATKWLHEFGWTPPDWIGEYTWLFEILYPENRIVVDYEGKQSLVLLDVIDMNTGLSQVGSVSEIPALWPGEHVEQFEYKSVVDVLASEPRVNREGFVIYHEETGHRVKVKYDEYVRLHRLVTGVTARSIWELLATGKPLDELLSNVPDEFYAWVEKTANDLCTQHEALTRDASENYEAVRAEVNNAAAGTALDQREGRKLFALTAQKMNVPHMSAMFMLLDDNPGKLVEYAWRQIKPSADRPFNVTEVIE